MKRTTHASKTYYTVRWVNWGMDHPITAYFDSKAAAVEFADHDYRDSPIAHRVSKPRSIRAYDRAVIDTLYDITPADKLYAN